MTDPIVQWVKQLPIFNTSAYDAYPSIAVDASGNVYVSYFTKGGTVSGGTNNGSSEDIVVFKLDTSGNVLWIRQLPIFNTSEYDAFPSIDVDASGNVYVSYFTNGAVSGGTNNSGTQDIVVFKLDISGNVLWTSQLPIFNTSEYDVNPSIAVDASGNVYVSYSTDKGIVSGGTNNSGTQDIVVFKLDTSGNVQWTRQLPIFNTSSYDVNPSIGVDTSGNVYISYWTKGTVSGGTNNSSTQDIVVFKLDTDGNVLWTSQLPIFNTSNYDAYPSIAVLRAVDASGNVYVSYITTGTVSGGTFAGFRDIVVFKLDTDGNVLWTNQLPIFNTSDYDAFPSIAVDAFGNVYVSYLTAGTVSGGTNNGSSRDIVVFKLGIPTQVICVFPGALVYTTNGLKKIEDLRSGDILFDDRGYQIELINNVKCHSSYKGYTTFYKDCFAINVPSADLIITDGHPIRFPYSNKEIRVERLANDTNIIRREGPIPETYSLVTNERIFIQMNNIPVCTWSESKFRRYSKNENLEYTLL